MIKLCFNIASTFWVLAPIAFLIGRARGIWDFHKDIVIFAFLMAMCFVVCAVHVFIAFWNYRDE